MMERILQSLICLLLISASAEAQEQYKQITVCFNPWPWADRKLESGYELGSRKPVLLDQHSAVQILQAKIDIAKMVPSPALGAHRTALVSEDKISPYRPLRMLTSCQVADLYPDGRIAIH
jgi:hypothetical protein